MNSRKYVIPVAEINTAFNADSTELEFEGEIASARFRLER